jgi:hypothetical protein
VFIYSRYNIGVITDITQLDNAKPENHSSSGMLLNMLGRLLINGHNMNNRAAEISFYLTKCPHSKKKADVIKCADPKLVPSQMAANSLVLL